MKEEFKNWVEKKTQIAWHPNGEIANPQGKLLWEAWQRAWCMAVELQHQKDKEKIDKLEVRLRHIKYLVDRA